MSSPQRPEIMMTRPEWPWSYQHRASHPPTSTPSAPGSSSGTHTWDPQASSATSSPATVFVSSTAPPRQANSLPFMSTPITQQHGIRNWTFAALEWVVPDVERLSRSIESDTDLNGDDDHLSVKDDDQSFEILSQSPLLGDGKFKLEIARTAGAQTLSLYVTSLVVGYSRNDYEVSATVLAAIKTNNSKAGERGARTEWVWKEWQNDWTFRQESEVWGCPLPPLSELLKNSKIRETDSFVICVQIHSPVGPFYPQQPSVAYVPRNLLDGLEASLDNSNTGDVQFICLERADPNVAAHQPPDQDPASSPTTTSSSGLEPSFFSSHAFARKRVIYAHSDILKRRSEYFATMLSSSFSENGGSIRPGERKVYTVVLEEADFVTVYWLLKWIYANWLSFRSEDDPRLAIEGTGAGWSAKWLNTSGKGEWEWKRFTRVQPGEDMSVSRSDARSVASATESAGSGDIKGKTKGVTEPLVAFSNTISSSTTPRTGSTPSRNAGPSSGPLPTKSQSRQQLTTNLSLSRRSNTSTDGSAKPASEVSNSPLPSPTPVSAHQPTTSTGFTNPQRYSAVRQTSVPDPHPHPTPEPLPASALSVYRLAHRYDLDGLASLALEHMMTTITPEYCFSLLLASRAWDELHGLVQDYVVDKWEEVSMSAEFERCCDEVAAGDWGTEGGKTLMALFRRLRSPNAVTFPRT
ncbi:hypothetical protein BJ322DRAFT_1073795 [Thelephora terrestris]|uniref:BTB domain-containing protein n=1 Tax=Thelephora terrestris TaxID=56493 RepID=A0A9P6HDJ5_9AGAM|nr:hypothetical protein BJ322DRAFT_1073795 [Thelephora terrestris]